MVAAAVACIATVGWFGMDALRGGPDTGATDGGQSAPISVTTVEAVSVEMSFDAESAMRSVRAEYVLDGRPVIATLLDDTRADDASSRTLTDVAAGDKIDVYATLFPTCEGAPIEAPVLTIAWTSTGAGDTTRTVKVANEQEYTDAVRGWCASGPRAVVGGGTTSADHSVAHLFARVTNPTSQPITVLSSDVTVHGFHWIGASHTVPAQAQETITVTVRSTESGLDVHCASWPADLLSVDGRDLETHAGAVRC
jgi:hypothetical protein